MLLTLCPLNVFGFVLYMLKPTAVSGSLEGGLHHDPITSIYRQIMVYLFYSE